MVELRGRLLDDKGKLAEALRDVLEVTRRPNRVRILTSTIGPFDVNGSTFATRLKLLLANGALVTLIFGEDPSRMESGKQRHVMELHRFGVKVFHNPRMHAKLVLAEGKRGRALLLGSANMTGSGFWRNYELGLRAEVSGEDAFRALDTYINRALDASSTKSL